MAKKLDVNYFPRWTRRSLTFTIDDGNVAMDQKFLSILRPHGILGTFNLCSHMLSALDADGYREFYHGYEIANHCKNTLTRCRMVRNIFLQTRNFKRIPPMFPKHTKPMKQAAFGYTSPMGGV